jgi:uncharacterized repeat protein (TIGR01451 family)
MKKNHWWLLGGLVAASVMVAAVLGPAVLGQPEVPPVKLPGDVPFPPAGSWPAPPGPGALPPPAVNKPTPPAPTPTAPVGPAMPVGLPQAPAVPPGPSPGLATPPLPEPVGLPGAIKPVGAGPFVPLPPSDKPELQSPSDPAPLPPPPAPKLEPGMTHLVSKESTAVTEARLGRQEPSASLEWVGPPSARLNQPMACQLVVRNTCASTLQNVVVRHRLGQGVTCRASDPQPTVEQGELIWTLGAIPPGQVRRIDVQLLAQVKGPLTCQATVTFSGTATHQVQVSEPQLMVKMKAPERVISGETVTLLFAVSNPGDGSAQGVKLKAILPEGLEHQRGRAVEVDLGTLAAKEIRTLQLVCAARGSGPQKVLAMATGDGSLNATDSAALEVLLPKLELAVLGPKLRYIDRKATYTLKVTNPGSAPAANVVLHGGVPQGFKYATSSAGGMYDEGTRACAWVLGDLQPGQTREVALDLVPTTPGEHRLVAQVTSAQGLKTGAEMRTVVEGLPALLIEVADTDDPVEVGSETTYEVRVANAGTKTETNVEVVCTLPEQVEFRGAKAGANLRFRVEGREVIFEPLAKLAPRAEIIYRVQVRGKTAGDVRFRARVRADGLPEPVLREESTRFYNDDVPLR